jgi:intracellular sulfur oxidation DsrE/DsrF family protein
MKKILLLVFLAMSGIVGMAQTTTNPSTKIEKVRKKPYKIVFQMISKSPNDHTSLMRQLKNITSVAPKGTQLEVVCHGGGLEMLVGEKSSVKEDVEKYIQQGVQFKACRFTMTRDNVTEDMLIKGSGTVQAGVLEIAEKQEKGWAYIKAGN